MRKTKISVIIPTYNRARFIKRAISSVLCQTYQNFEIIVVDGPSTDNTQDIVKKIQDKRIKYMRPKIQRGVSAARNAGIDQAKGEFIAFLDSDDEWLPEKLEKQMDVFENGDPGIGVVSTGFFIINKKNKLAGIVFPKYRGFLKKEIFFANPRIGTSTVLVKRECFKTVGQFDINLLTHEDLDLWLRISEYFKFDFVSDSLVKYYMHDDNQSDNPEAMKGFNVVFQKLRDKIEQNNKIKAAYYFNFGNCLCHFGKMKKGRHNLMKAIVAWPWNIKYFIYFIASLFGKKIYSGFVVLKRMIKKISFIL